MAYDNSQVQQTDDEQQRSGAQVPGNPITQLSGGSGGGFAGSQGGASAPSTQGANAPGTPTSSGSWTNLSSYLNENADQSAGMGQTIANTVQGQAQQAQNDLGNVVTGFENQSPFTNLNNTTSAQVGAAINNPGQYAPVTGNGVTTQPDTSSAELYLNGGNSSGAGWGITPTTNDITAFAPNSGPNWGTTQGAYNKAGQSLQDTQSESGRDILLQNEYGQNGSSYNPGEQAFDQLLLEQNPSNAQALNTVYNQFAPNEVVPQSTTNTNPSATTQNAASTEGLPLDLYNAIQASQGYATGEENKAAGFQTQAQTDLANQIQGLGSNVSNEVTAGSNQFNADYNAIQQAINGGASALTAAQAQELGLPQNLNIDLYGVNPGQFLSESANPFAGPGAQNAAATAQDWAKYQGLNALINGMEGGPQASDQQTLASIGLTGTQPTTPTNTNPTNFNLGGLQAAAGNAEASYKDALTKLGLYSVPGEGEVNATQYLNLLNGPGWQGYSTGLGDEMTNPGETMNLLNAINKVNAEYGQGAYDPVSVGGGNYTLGQAPTEDTLTTPLFPNLTANLNS